MRKPRKTATFVVDLRKPISDEIMSSTKEGDCFGKQWDVVSSACAECGDKDVCGIVYRQKVDAKAKKVEKKTGSKFLDRTDFENIKKESLIAWLKSGETTSKELIAEVSKLAECDDRVAVIEWIKRFIKGDNSLSIKGGIVYVK